MSLDKMLQEVVRREVAEAMKPLVAIVEELQEQGALVGRLASVLGAPMPAKKLGRPPKLTAAPKLGRKPKAEKPEKEEAGASEEGARLCALEDCGRPARSKGYCAAHYQKYRMLQKTGRLPEDWTEFAPVGSVKNVTLPRGRAGAKAIATAKGKGKD